MGFGVFLGVFVGFCVFVGLGVFEGRGVFVGPEGTDIDGRGVGGAVGKKPGSVGVGVSVSASAVWVNSALAVDDSEVEIKADIVPATIVSISPGARIVPSTGALSVSKACMVAI